MNHLLTGMPRTEADLDDQLSTPSDHVAQALESTSGDVVVLGAGGKVGPTLARMVRRALPEDRKVLAVSRWSDPVAKERLESWGIVPVTADLGDPDAYAALPDAGAMYYLLGHKFGSSTNQHLTWWLNAVAPGLAASRYRGVPTVAYSSGNVYPFVPPHTGGCTELDPPGPVGTYAQSCLAREQAFAHAASLWNTPVSIYRLNYAVEQRYGVIADIATKIMAGEPIDVTMGAVNVIWQRDSTEWSVRSIEHASAGEPFILNGTGPETASTRALATQLGEILEREVTFVGTEADEALLNNAAKAHALYGYPKVSLAQAVAWAGEWVKNGGHQLGKATKFQTRDGKF